MSLTQEPEAQRSRPKRAGNLMVAIVPIVACFTAIYILWGYLIGPRDLGLLVALYVLTGLGVSMGYHRLLTHRSFRTYAAIRYSLAVLGSMSSEGPPTEWVANHRKHHALADREGDPHSPNLSGRGFRGAFRGLLHAHLGWLFAPTPAEDRMHYAPDMMSDKGMRIIDRLQPLIVTSGLVLPIALGWMIGGTWAAAASAFVWGGLVRIVMVHHVTRSIDSICHFFGKRRFETHDLSRNVGWLCILSLGESYHNTHHAFPKAAVLHLRKTGLDVAGFFIVILERLGLAWQVIRVTPSQLARREQLD